MSDGAIVLLWTAMMLATIVYGLVLYERYGDTSRDTWAWEANVLALVGSVILPVSIPLTVWAHVRYRREARSREGAK